MLLFDPGVIPQWSLRVIRQVVDIVVVVVDIGLLFMMMILW